MLAVRRGCFGLAALLSLLVLFAPGDDVPSAPYVDKLVHFGLFALLAGIGRWAGFRPGPLGVTLLGYGVLSELVQAWVDALGRSGGAGDVLADAFGVAVGLTVARWCEPGS